MTIKPSCSAAAALVVASALATSGYAFQTDEQSVQRFTDRVTAYAALHENCARTIRGLQVSADPKAILAASGDLADAIRARRASAQQGDLFTDDVAPVFIERIHQVLKSNYLNAHQLLVELFADAPAVALVAEVNEPFDWRFGSLMPAPIVTVLPPLPEMLQYKFVGPDLVIVDIDAGLVIDVLPDVLAAN